MSGETNWTAEAMQRQKRGARPRVPPAVIRATKWLSDRPIEHWPTPLVPEVSRLFAVSDVEAAQAVKDAHAVRAGRAN